MELALNQNEAKIHSNQELHSALIDIYQEIKIQKSGLSIQLSSGICKKERKKLENLNPILIINKIRNSLKNMFNNLAEYERKKFETSQAPSDTGLKNADSLETIEQYEQEIIKLEGESREYIRALQMIRINYDDALYRIEELEQEKKRMNPEIEKLKSENKIQQNLIQKYENQLKELKKQIQTADKGIKNSNKQKKEIGVETVIDDFPSTEDDHTTKAIPKSRLSTDTLQLISFNTGTSSTLQTASSESPSAEENTTFNWLLDQFSKNKQKKKQAHKQKQELNKTNVQQAQSKVMTNRRVQQNIKRSSSIAPEMKSSKRLSRNSQLAYQNSTQANTCQEVIVKKSQQSKLFTSQRRNISPIRSHSVLKQSEIKLQKKPIKKVVNFGKKDKPKVFYKPSPNIKKY